MISNLYFNVFMFDPGNFCDLVEILCFIGVIFLYFCVLVIRSKSLRYSCAVVFCCLHFHFHIDIWLLLVSFFLLPIHNSTNSFECNMVISFKDILYLYWAFKYF